MGDWMRLGRWLFKCLQQGETGCRLRIAARFSDLLVVPWLLDVGMLVAYLFARAVTMPIPFALLFLGRRAQPQLDLLWSNQEADAFRAAAARVNLGYLMVCGGMAVLTIALVPRIYISIGYVDPIFHDTLIWLAIGQAAPVAFGATSVLMRVVGRSTFHDLLMGVTAAFYLVCAFGLSHHDAVSLAQTLAAAQLTQAAVCALLLTQSGVWPGLTALLHREIQLFQRSP